MQADVMVTETAPRKPGIGHWLAALFMAACFAVAWLLTPHQSWFEHLGRPSFEEVVPREFGDWVETGEGGGGYIVDPQQQGALDAIYTQIVSRTYLHKPSGRTIMLSLAYGDNQSYARQLHRPESCYSSQGLKIESLREDKLRFHSRDLNLVRMTAQGGFRREQVSYFIRIGERIISGPASELNKARMAMGLKGYVADGLLFRVSELAEDPGTSNPLHDRFIRELLESLDPGRQAMLIGPAA